MNADTLLAGLDSAQMVGRSTYMEAGRFVVELTNVMTKPRFKGGNVFIVEFKICESSNPDHEVGSTGSWVVKIENPSSFGDMKAFAIAACGMDPKTIKQDNVDVHTQAANIIRAACGSDSAKKALGVSDGFLNGRLLNLETVKVKTRDQKDFTRHTWGPYRPAATAA